MKKFEEEFWDRPPVRRVPDLEPDFDKFKREYLDKMEPITEEERRSIAERNRQLLVKRARQKRRILSMAACAAVAVGVVGTAIWLGHDGAVVPHPESGAETSEGAEESIHTVESSAPIENTTGYTEMSNPHLQDDVVTYNEAVQLTGLPLIKADELEGFVEYRVSKAVGKVTTVNYVFNNFNVYIHCDNSEIPLDSGLLLQNYVNKDFLYKETIIEGIGSRTMVYYMSPDGILFVGNVTDKTVDESIELLNSLIFD